MMLTKRLCFKKEWCKLCKLCEKHCPKQAIKVEQTVEVDQNKCINCNICEKACPDMALELKK